LQLQWLGKRSRTIAPSSAGLGFDGANLSCSNYWNTCVKGRVYCITKRGKPVAELRPMQASGQRPRRGVDRGRVVMREDFDAPLPDFDAYMN
jgi:hypothetical protein